MREIVKNQNGEDPASRGVAPENARARAREGRSSASKSGSSSFSWSSRLILWSLIAGLAASRLLAQGGPDTAADGNAGTVPSVVVSPQVLDLPPDIPPKHWAAASVRRALQLHLFE